MNVYGVQTDTAWHDAAANRTRVRRLIEAAGVERGGLIALPETFASGFTNDVAAAAADNVETLRFLADLARGTACHVVAGLVTDDGPGLVEGAARGRNVAVCFDADGTEVARYAKMNRLPTSGEDRHFVAGAGNVSFAAGGMTVCPLICYDLRFPMTWHGGRGGEVFVLIANWPAARMHHWHALLRARAVENQAYVVAVNRCGRDPNVGYSGGSVVYDFDGGVVTGLDDQPGVMTATLDLPALREFRRRLPFLP